MKKTLLATCVAFYMGATPLVMAGQLKVDINSTDASAYQNHLMAGALADLGVGNATKYTGYGHDLPLITALQLIVPKGFEVYSQKDLDMSTKVSWSSKNEPWTNAVKDVLSQSGLAGQVQWSIKRIMVQKPYQAPVPSGYRALFGVKHVATVTPSKEMKAAKVTVSQEKKATKNVTKTEVAVKRSPQLSLDKHELVAYLPAGGYLRDELRDYANARGWDLKWKLDYDYKINKPIPMAGDVPTAVQNLVNNYQALGGLQAVTPFFMTGGKTPTIFISTVQNPTSEQGQ